MKKTVERKLEDERMLQVKAVLLRPVSFITQEGAVSIKSGTEILVDPETNIGHFNRQHFDVETKEYKILYLN